MKEGGGGGGVWARGSTGPTHPVPSAKRPFFPFWEGVQLGAGVAGGGLGKPPGLLHSRDSLRQPLSREECSASSPEGAGPLSVPQTSFVLCALHPGPLLAFTSQDFRAFFRASRPGRLRRTLLGKAWALGDALGPETPVWEGCLEEM